MKVMGIDPATKRLGVGIVKITRGGRIKLVDVTEVSTLKDNLHERLEYIHIEVGKLLKSHKPKSIGIESQFLGMNPKSMRLVCYSVGVVWASIFDHVRDADVTIYEASKWRSLALGRGNASKEEAIEAVSSMFDLNPSSLTDNMAEALAIAVATAIDKKVAL